MRKLTQSIIEYTMLVLAISAAIVVMTNYIKNAMDGRFVEITKEFNDSQR
ncbi:MAG: hypothetical protein KBB01_00525 [Candidatus Omnitrophica bacterium]|nr:hypothetical protein [Candidatus Omnitrophota bacterium]